MNKIVLLIFALIAFSFSLFMYWRDRERIGFKKFGVVFVFSLFSTICGVIGGLLLARFETLIDGSNAAIRIYGIFLFWAPIMLGVAHMMKINKKAFFDSASIAIIPSLCLCRLFCFSTGCCSGKFIFSTQLKWPTRETELLFLIVLLFVFLFEKKDNRNSGELYPKFMIGYGCFRFVNECFRVGSDIGMGLHLAHVWSLICIVVGASIYLEMTEHKKHRKRGK